MAGLLAAVEGKADALSGDKAAGVVAHHHGHEARLAGGAGQRAGDARQALHDRIIGRAVVVTAAAAEGQDRAMDQPRVFRRQARMVEAGAAERLGPHVAHEHVGAGDQAAYRRKPIGLLEVEHYRALVAVKVDELARQAGIAAALRHAAQKVAARRLDLEPVGAVVGQGARADRPDDDGREVDDAHAGPGTVAHLANSSSISPHSTPFLSAAQIFRWPSFCASPRTSIKSPTHSGCTRRAVTPLSVPVAWRSAASTMRCML